MTDTDATNRPIEMPVNYLPYLQKYRVYKLFKDMLGDMIVALPKDHLRHMKVFLSRRKHSSTDVNRIMLLVSPDLDIDVKKLVKELIKDLGHFVITRRSVMDQYEKMDDYKPGCISTVLLSKTTKMLVSSEAVKAAGWLMFDHPCTFREARCLQADGVLPTVTLVLLPPLDEATMTPANYTPRRYFFDQHFEELCYAYKATLKEVHVTPEDKLDQISAKCFNGIKACVAGAQGPRQGLHVVGAPGVYRVLVIGPRGSGRKTQARLLANHFRLVYVDFWALYKEAKGRNDDIGTKLRNYGPSVTLKADIIKRKILEKDCLDNGWVMVAYPACGADFEKLDNMPTPPNRVIILSASPKTCKERAMAVALDWCTGKRIPRDAAGAAANKRAAYHERNTEAQIDDDLDYYFLEALAELRAAAGLTAVEISAENESLEEIQVKIRAAVMAAPAFDLVTATQLRNAKDAIELMSERRIK